GQADQPQRALRRLEGPPPRRPALAEEAGEGHVLEQGQPAERPGDLEGPADAEVDDPVRGLPGELVPFEPDRARVGDERTREQVEDRALAGSVGSDQPEDLTRLDRERDLIHGDEAAEALGQPFDGQHVTVTRWARSPPGQLAA